jgi:hypothetical protein
MSTFETIIVVDEEELQIIIEDSDEVTINIEDPEAVIMNITDAGPKGDAGPSGLAWKGAWDSGTNYVQNDGVHHDLKAWIATAPSNNQPPSLNPPGSAFWDLFADSGPQGPAGTGIIWTGVWSGATNYNQFDAVEDAGSAYVAKSSHINQQPPNATYWDLLASKGDQGPAGSNGTNGSDGNTVLSGSGPPDDVSDGVDGDHYVDETNRIFYSGKASGSWNNAVQIPLAANPNGARLTTSGNTQNPNASTAIAVEWQNQVRIDLGVNHSTGTNPSRIGPATGKGGRYEIFAAINYNNPSGQRINLNLWLQKNGSGTALKAEGQTFGGYSRNNGNSKTSTAFFHWEGELLDTDYVELMSEQGDISGSVSIMDDSFLNFKQTTLLENQAGGSGFDPGSYTDITLESLFSDSVENAQYRINSGGRLYCKGLVRRTAGTSNVPFYFPAGARPQYDTYGGVTDFANGSTYRYRIKASDGEFSIIGITTGNNLDLNCIQFDT